MEIENEQYDRLGKYVYSLFLSSISLIPQNILRQHDQEPVQTWKDFKKEKEMFWCMKDGEIFHVH